MNFASKLIMICIFFFTGINHLNAQYTTDSYSPTALLSEDLKAPGKMAVDSDDNIYAVDAIQKSIVKYDSQGIYLTTIITDFSPTTIAINEVDLLFVGDKETGNIYTVSENGTKTLFYTGVVAPNAMIFGLNILYVTYSQQKKVVGIDISGTIVTDFTYGKFVFLTGIAFDPQNNKILVAEHGGVGEDMERPGSCSMCWSSYGPQTAIYVFDLDGNHERTFGFFGHEDGQFQRIQGIAVGPCGNYYAVDPYLGRVSVFDNAGNFVTKFGLQGDSMGEFNLPMDIVFTDDNRAVVSSMNKGVIDVFSITSVLPTASITSANQTICAMENAVVDILFTGEGPWTFTYTVDGINPVEVSTNEPVYNLSVSEAGLYEVASLVDKNYVVGTCFTGATNIMVNELPTATFLAAELSKCTNVESGVDVQLTGIGPWTFTYTIDGINPIEINTSESLYTIQAEQSGNYEIKSLTDAGCFGINLTENINVTVYPLPTSIITNEENFARINLGESADFIIAFTGTAPYTFTYSRNGLDGITITTSENPYTLTLTENGVYEILSITDLYCSNMNYQGYFDIYYNSLPTATIATTTSCENDPDGISIYFSGTAPLTFTYTVDGLNPTEIITSNNPYLLDPSSTGVFELLSVYDSVGTMGTVSGAAVVYPAVTAEYFYEVTNYDVQFTNSSANADTHYWDFGDGTFSIEESPIHTYSSAGNYSVVYTATNTNCGTSEFTEIIEIIGDVLSINPNNKYKNNSIAFYPNPSNGQFTIKITPPNPIVSNISIAITSSLGQTIYTEVFNPLSAISFDGSIYKEIYLSNFTKGVYMVYVQTDNFVAQEKLILKY